MSQLQVEAFYKALKNREQLTSFIVRKRDLVILNLFEAYLFIVACDSNASIGLKEHDYVRRELREVGRSAVKVPLMEVLAVGALPFVIVDALCVEMEPTGRGILEGIRFEVQRLGLDPDLIVTGSAEKNMITTQTGLGVTVIGIVSKEELQLGTSQHGDVVACVGIPKSAPDRPYFEGDPEITDPPTVMKLRQSEFVHGIIPVGSRGVRYEMGVLAEESGCKFIEVTSPIDMQASAGASTCVLVTLPERHLGDLKTSATQPVNKVGYLQRSLNRK